jgi:uncharacterized protein (DUF849 family)
MTATPMFVTVAPTGAESGYADNPGIPLQPEEIVAQAIECEAAGAALIHIHGRDARGGSSLDHGVLRAIMDGVRESTRLIIQLSTGGGVHDSPEDRLRVVDLAPESCSLTCGTVNFGRSVFANPLPFIEQLYLAMLERQVMPEFECFELGHIETLNRLLDKHGAPTAGTVHCNLVMGVPGAMPGTLPALVTARASLPTDASWSATGIGRTSIPVMLGTLAMGGNLRVGMEDTLRYSAEEMVTDNAQLVRRAVALGRSAQVQLRTADETRADLGLAQLP